jgi:hypothetical protein
MANTEPKPVKMTETTKTTAKGPFGGGTPYHVAKISNDFAVVDSRPGHTQKENVKPAVKK